MVTYCYFYLVTFVPEEKKDVYITRQFDTDLPWEGL